MPVPRSTDARRRFLRALALLLLLGFGAMEYVHLEHHCDLELHADHDTSEPDCDCALFNFGAITEPPVDLVSPASAAPNEFPSRTLQRPSTGHLLSGESRAPPRLV